MRFWRIRSDHVQLSLIHSTRNSNSEDFDSGLFCQLRFDLRLFWVDVGGSISDKKYESTNVSPSSSLFDKHLCACSLQSTCYVGISAVNVQILQHFQNAVRFRVVVQVEYNIRFVTKLHQTDLCPVWRNPECLYNTGGKPKYFYIPVVIVGFTCDQTT